MLCLIVSVLAGCDKSAALGQPESQQPIAPQPELTGFPTLDGISASVASLGSGSVLNGAGYDDLWPSNLVTREVTSASYSPNWNGSITSAAYATYTQDFTDATRGVSISFDWTTPPSASGNPIVFWIGLANWDPAALLLLGFRPGG